MNRVFILIVGITLMGILTGCGQDPTEEKPPTEPPAVSIPPAQSPAPRAYPVTQETRDTYQFYCTQCHGTGGHGNGINAPHLTVPPRDHTKADYLETRTDEHLFTAIQQGGLAAGRAPCMPSWQHTLDENTIHSLVSYIRELCQCAAL
jgi:mono/diheme cytochrome c family protein